MHKTYDGERRFGKTNGRAWNAKVLEARRLVGREIERVMTDYATFRAAVRLTRNDEQAQELVQEAACRALSRAHQYSPEKAFGGWFATIMRNHFLDQKRAAKATVTIEGFDGEGFGLKDVLACEADAVEPGITAESIRNVLQAAIKELRPSYRQAVTLCCLRRMSYKDAARAAGTPMGTVRSRLHRARAALRTILADAEARP